MRSADIGFLFVGGVHQAMHIAPVALALAGRVGVAVTAYVLPADASALAAMLQKLDAAAAVRVEIVPMRPRGVSRLLPGKVGALVGWRRRLLRHDALVAAERTSTLLKRLPGRRPFMIHIPHGVGDRAQGFEPRIRLFDHVLVAGRGNRERMLAEGLVTPDTCEEAGAVKVSALVNAAPPPRLFDDDRPVVLYNPHFDVNLSSWPLAAQLADAIVAEARFNLIVAPHARLGVNLSPDERAAWMDRGARAGVIVDLGSERLSDMTYTRAADIYLGDVSSQVYEFAYRPRPAVFVDAHRAAWRDDPSYRMWTMGEVATDVPGTLAVLAHAQARHAEYVARQTELAADALGVIAPDVPERAADAILACLPARGR